MSPNIPVEALQGFMPVGPAYLGCSELPKLPFKERLTPVAEDKYVRQSLDAILQELKEFCDASDPENRISEERSIAIVKIKEAVMWLGMDLKAINEANPGAAENPYPHSYDPKSPIIDKTADGLKL